MSVLAEAPVPEPTSTAPSDIPSLSHMLVTDTPSFNLPPPHTNDGAMSLIQESATLDDAGIACEDVVNRDDTDHRMSGTMAGMDSGVLDSSAPSISASSSQAAVDLQVTQRLTHDIAQILPVLHGISLTLRNSSTVATSNMSEFLQVTRGIHEHIASMPVASHDSTVHGENTQSLPLTTRTIRPSTSTSGVNTSASEHKRLRAPSPEKRQKRKKSYGTL
ncbi:hypothetical protein C8Q76DRAFT_741516 [Earliella scabrosa]|nr:hypothetical protein C8Q76DRAFT_741516 [Earliella scabrosa]